MKTVFLIDNLKFSGGRRSFLEFAIDLHRKGHEVELLTLSRRGDLLSLFPCRQVCAFTSETIPDCDFILATTPSEVRGAVRSRRGRTVHLCQGFEVEDLQSRIDNKVIPHRYKGKGLYNRLDLAAKKLQWRLKIASLDRIYSMDTILVAISKHLKEVLEKRYSKEVHFCGYGVKREFFFHEESWNPRRFSPESPCRIISVGPVGVTFKGIPDTLEAVATLKAENMPIHFIRVSPDERKDEDLACKAIDEYHSNLSPKDLGALMRTCDIYVSNSLEGEGFGLPAMEAMSCGLLCVLSSISSYLNFGEARDFAAFVPERNPMETATAIRKLMSQSPEDAIRMRKLSLSISENFSLQNALDRLEKILLENLRRT